MQNLKRLACWGAGFSVLLATSTSSAAAIVAGAAVAAALSGSNGNSCTYSAPSKAEQEASGDIFYGADNFNWCQDEWLGPAAKNLGLAKKYWDDGFGWETPCSGKTQPLARLLHARVALAESHPDTAYSGAPDVDEPNMLIWGLRFVTTTLDDTRGKCEAYQCQSQTAYPDNDPDDEWLDLAILACASGEDPNQGRGFFYGKTVPGRAASLMHEAHHLRHHSSHTGKGVDKAYEPKYAYAYHASWLAWYSKEAWNAPIGLRCNAEEEANTILGNRFEEEPDFRFTSALCDTAPVIEAIPLCADPEDPVCNP